MKARTTRTAKGMANQGEAKHAKASRRTPLGQDQSSTVKNNPQSRAKFGTRKRKIRRQVPQHRIFAALRLFRERKKNQTHTVSCPGARTIPNVNSTKQHSLAKNTRSATTAAEHIQTVRDRLTDADHAVCQNQQHSRPKQSRTKHNRTTQHNTTQNRPTQPPSAAASSPARWKVTQ